MSNRKPYPKELVEKILLSCPVRLSIALRQEYCKRQLLPLIPFDHQWLQATKSGNLEKIQWLHRYNAGSSRWNIIEAAARWGHLHVLEWAHHETTDCSCKRRWEERFWTTANAAAQAGQLEVMKWLHEHCPDKCTTTGTILAVERGNLETLKWLHDNHLGAFQVPDAISMLLNRAEDKGCLEVFKWLHENVGPATDAEQRISRLEELERKRVERISALTHESSTSSNPHLPMCRGCAERVYEKRGSCSCSYKYDIEGVCLDCESIWRYNPRDGKDLEIVKQLFKLEDNATDETYARREVGIALCAGTDIDEAPEFSSGEDDDVKFMRDHFKHYGIDESLGGSYGEEYGNAVREMVRFRDEFRGTFVVSL